MEKIEIYFQLVLRKTDRKFRFFRLQEFTANLVSLPNDLSFSTCPQLQKTQPEICHHRNMSIVFFLYMFFYFTYFPFYLFLIFHFFRSPASLPLYPSRLSSYLSLPVCYFSFFRPLIIPFCLYFPLSLLSLSSPFVLHFFPPLSSLWFPVATLAREGRCMALLWVRFLGTAMACWCVVLWPDTPWLMILVCVCGVWPGIEFAATEWSRHN